MRSKALSGQYPKAVEDVAQAVIAELPEGRIQFSLQFQKGTEGEATHYFHGSFTATSIPAKTDVAP